MSDTRFQSGTSGNPSGQSRRSRTRAAARKAMPDVVDRLRRVVASSPDDAAAVEAARALLEVAELGGLSK